MNYFIFFIYLATYTTGFTALSMMFLLFLKTRIRTLLYFMIYIASFTGLLIMGNIEFYRINMLNLYNTYYNGRAIFLHHFFFGVMFLFIPLSLFKFLNIPFKLVYKIAFGIIFVFSILLVAPLYFPNVDKAEVSLFGFKVIALISHGITLFSIVTFIISINKIRVREKKNISIYLLCLNIFFIPFWVLEYLWNFNFNNPLRPLSFSNLYYFIINLMGVIFFYKYFFFSKIQFSSESIPEDIAVLYGITPREKEIVEMIAKGYTNKMTAAALGISIMTVRNHVYNIYQKTEADSKIDLINRLNRKKETAETRIAAILS